MVLRPDLPAASRAAADGTRSRAHGKLRAASTRRNSRPRHGARIASVASHEAAGALERLFRDAGEVLDGRTGARSRSEILAGARRRAEALEQDVPRFRRTMNRELFALGVPTLALYRTLREDAALPEADALASVDALLQAAYRRRLGSPLKRKLASRAFRLPVLRHVVAAIAERSREPGGFVMERVDRAPDVLLALDVHRCPLAELFARHGAPEVGPRICKLDDVMVEAFDGVELQRTGTIANGAERCDFRYRRSE